MRYSSQSVFTCSRLHRNRFVGTIPSEMLNLTKFGVLELDENRLIGQVPPMQVTVPSSASNLGLGCRFQTVSDSNCLDCVSYNGSSTCTCVSKASCSPQRSLSPIGHWTFESHEELVDRAGNFPPLKLFGTATVLNGTLDLNGVDNTATGWAVTDGLYSGPTIGEKTLVAWFQMDNVSVNSGSPLSVNHMTVDQFDAIVFGELETRRWMAGSSRFDRTRNFVPGFEEVLTSAVVQIGISYRIDGSTSQMRVEACRNGVVIGNYTLSSAQFAYWPNGTVQVMFGPRHQPNGEQPGRGAIDAHIHEVRLYGTALSVSEIAALTMYQPSVTTTIAATMTTTTTVATTTAEQSTATSPPQTATTSSTVTTTAATVTTTATTPSDTGSTTGSSSPSTTGSEGGSTTSNSTSTTIATTSSAGTSAIASNSLSTPTDDQTYLVVAVVVGVLGGLLIVGAVVGLACFVKRRRNNGTAGDVALSSSGTGNYNSLTLAIAPDYSGPPSSVYGPAPPAQ
jgi:hypothetical protein